MTTTLDESEVVTATSQEQANLLPQLGETTRRLLEDIDRAEEVLTRNDEDLLYSRIVFAEDVDVTIEKDEKLIRELYDLLVTNKESFKRIENTVNVYLKYEEHRGDSPNLIEKYRYIRRMFNTAFKRYDREEQARQSEILAGGRKRKRKRKYRSKKRKSNKLKRKYRSKKRKS